MTTTFTRLEEADRDEVPTALCRLDSGWVFFGDSQFLRGYCILFAQKVNGYLHANLFVLNNTLKVYM